MGTPAPGIARKPSHVSSNQHLAALCAFPSPASVHEPLDTPVLEHALKDARATYQPFSPQHGGLPTSSILPAQPDDVNVQCLTTPPLDEMPVPDMNVTVGGALAPVHSTVPSRVPPRRFRPSFRLPSFQSLGIANPNPDRFGLDGNLSHSSITAVPRPLSAPYASSGLSAPGVMLSAALHDCSISPTGIIPTGRAIQSPIQQLVNTLTPPAESGHIDWSHIPTVTTALESPMTDPGTIAPTDLGSQGRAVTSAGGIPSQISGGPLETESSPPWIRGSIDVLGRSIGHIKE